MKLTLDDDAFGHAQIISKRSMAEAIETTVREWAIPIRLDLYAGWYGVLAMMLMTRDRIQIDHIRSYDIDSEATQVALRMNRALTIHGFKFSAFTKDVNEIYPDPNKVDMVVNTSVEHMDHDDWFRNIPSGMLVGLQGTDMVHDNEIVPNPIRSIDHLMEKYPLNTTDTPKRISFTYSGKVPFERFQVIGRKR